jgi:transcriptional regulator with XRE-family HTH domain
MHQHNGSPLFAEIVRRRREHYGVTQGALAARLGISQPAISKLERGATPIGEDTMARIAEALGVSLPELLLQGIEEIENHGTRKDKRS